MGVNPANCDYVMVYLCFEQLDFVGHVAMILMALLSRDNQMRYDIFVTVVSPSQNSTSLYLNISINCSDLEKFAYYIQRYFNRFHIRNWLVLERSRARKLLIVGIRTGRWLLPKWGITTLFSSLRLWTHRHWRVSTCRYVLFLIVTTILLRRGLKLIAFQIWISSRVGFLHSLCRW